MPHFLLSLYTETLYGQSDPSVLGGERYFFTFTDGFTRYTETYTGAKKSDWFMGLKAFHNLCKTRSNKERPVHRLRSDYGSELQSKRVEEWLEKEGIIFEPSAPYSQEQNGVSERVGRTIMDMTRATILEGNLCDNLWPEIVVAMTYIKKIWRTKALEGNSSPYYAQHQEDPDINHLRILGSTVYVFLHEEERDLKWEKWKARALRGKLVGFDGHTIYRVYIEQQAKVIRIKDLRIFEDYEPKDSTGLPTYEETPTFQGFPADDDDDKEPKDYVSTTTPSGPAITPSRSPPRKEVNPATRSRAGRTVRPTEKVKQMSSTKTPPIPLQTPETQALIIQLVQLLDRDWDTTLANTEETSELESPQDNPIRILATKLHTEANALDPSRFVCSTQLDVEEPETYNRAMQGPHAAQWS